MQKMQGQEPALEETRNRKVITLFSLLLLLNHFLIPKTPYTAYLNSYIRPQTEIK
jgi:hypothetical protein